MGDEGSDIIPKYNIKPIISIEESKNLVEKLYGVKIKEITELVSYDDKNYKIIVEEKCDNENIPIISANGYVFKILNKYDSNKIDFIQAQKDMMLFLNKNNIHCSKPVKNKNGDYYSLERIENSGDHIVRLLEFLPGEIFCNVPPSAELFYNAGQFLANLDTVLKNFYHAAYKTHQSPWMLESVSEVRKFLSYVKSPDDQKMIEEIIFEYEVKVLPNLGALEKSFIHGDYNEQNIVVRKNDKGNWIVDAVLDFGDTQYSCLLFEIAIGVTYMIIQAQNIKMAGHFLAGYANIRPIPPHEFKLLKACIAARFCQSLVMGTYANSLNPDNKYVLTTQAAGWTLLRQLWKEPNEKLLNQWKNIIDDNKSLQC